MGMVDGDDRLKLWREDQALGYRNQCTYWVKNCGALARFV